MVGLHSSEIFNLDKWGGGDAVRRAIRGPRLDERSEVSSESVHVTQKWGGALSRSSPFEASLAEGTPELRGGLPAFLLTPWSVAAGRDRSIRGHPHLAIQLRRKFGDLRRRLHHTRPSQRHGPARRCDPLGDTSHEIHMLAVDGNASQPQVAPGYATWSRQNDR